MSTNTDVSAPAPPPPTVAASCPPPINAAVSASAAVDVAELRRAVLTTVLANCEPADLPKGWRFLPQTDFAHRLRVQPAELLAELNRAHSAHDLLASRVLVRGQNELRLSPVFGSEGAKLVFAFDTERRPLYISSDRGVLSHCGPMAIPYGIERAQNGSSSESEPVLLAETVDDLQVLHELGFKAISSRGLEWLNSDHIHKLFPKVAAKDALWRYRFLVVDWNVVGFVNQRRARAGLILKHLADAQRVYGIDPGRRFAVLRPKRETVEKILVFASFGDANSIREELLNTLPQPKLGITWKYHVAPTELTLAAAKAALELEVAQSKLIPRVPRVSQALERYRNVFNKQIVDKLINGVDPSRAPLDLWSDLHAVELAENWFNMQDVVVAAKIIINGDYAVDTSADELWEKRMRIAEKLTRIWRDRMRRN